MFSKTNDYRKITFITYPSGNMIHTAKSSFDFDKGASAVEKYLNESEKFKMNSLKAQSDTKENATLSDDTLKITVEIGKFSFTFISAAGFINVAYAKVLAHMSDAELEQLQKAFLNRETTEFPRMLEFQSLINNIVGEENGVDVAFKAHIRLHDSYTPEHTNAIKYIISSMCGTFEETDTELIVTSEDPDLKNAIIDLGMSTYFDIEIED